MPKAYLVPINNDFGFGPRPDELAAQALAQALEVALPSLGLVAHVDWYYDEFVEPVEHGVKLEIEGVSKERFAEIIEVIAESFRHRFDDLVIKQP